MINNEKEYVLCAAIWYNDGKTHPHQSIYGIDKGYVICGHRHHNIMGVVPTNPTMNGGAKTEQGFITSTGRFVNRKDAMTIARNNGQLINSDQAKKELYSEDIY